MNLINGEELEDVVTKLNEQGFGITRNEFKRIELVISEFPTVYAEPVVRCKECIYLQESGHCNKTCLWVGNKEDGGCDDFFCGYGERREDE